MLPLPEMSDTTVYPTADIPVGCGFQFQQDILSHLHPFHELVIVSKGSAEHLYGDQRYRITRGDVFLIKPGISHAYRNTHDLELFNILYFPAQLNLSLYDLPTMPGYHAFFEFEPALRSIHGVRGCLHVETVDLEFLKSLAMEYCQEILAHRDGFLFRSVSLLMQIMFQVARLYRPEGGADEVRSDLLLLGRVLSLLQTRYSAPVKIGELAKKAAMSQSSFYRTFRKTMGMSPCDYLMKLRLEHACELLERSSHSISQIAADSGFDDSNYFSRAFRKNYGTSPRMYRSRHKQTVPQSEFQELNDAAEEE